MEVVLLLGAPGVGKSTLGIYMVHKHCCSFLSTGNWLREQGLLENKSSAKKLRKEAWYWKQNFCKWGRGSLYWSLSKI